MSGDEYWESAYRTGEYKHWEYNYPSSELVALVAAGLFHRNARVLEVGSGGGNDAIFMAGQGFNVSGVDISLAALKIARNRAKKAKIKIDWLRGSVLKLPIGDKTIDLISDRGLFHLIEDDQRPRYADEVFRVLKKGGRALIRGKSVESSYERFNPITQEAVDRYFPGSKFKRGPILHMPLLSIAGSMDAMIVMLKKER